MAEMSALRATMVAGQILPNRVTDVRVIAALQAVPREIFVPKAMRSLAYIDEDIAVANGRYLMEPLVLARLLEATAIESSDLVLDIGCATGYSTAVLAQLSSAVVAVEEVADLARLATENLLEMEVGNAAVVEGRLAEGYAKEAPYDVILINGTVDYVPDTVLDQLGENGRIACVRTIGGVGRGCLGTKIGGTVIWRDVMDANVPALPGFSSPKGFQF